MEKNPPNARLMALSSSWSDLAVYGTALGLVILAIFLGFQAGLAYALAALLLAALSLVTVTKVLRHKNAALLQKELSDAEPAAIPEAGFRRGALRRHRP